MTTKDYFVINPYMINEQYKYSDITAKIIGCAMKVHSVLSNGFQEVIYQRCLALEWKNKDCTLQENWICPYFTKE